MAEPQLSVWSSKARELALPSVAIAEIAFGIAKIRPDQRVDRMAQGLEQWCRRFADRIFSLTEDGA